MRTRHINAGFALRRILFSQQWSILTFQQIGVDVTMLVRSSAVSPIRTSISHPKDAHHGRLSLPRVERTSGVIIKRHKPEELKFVSPGCMVHVASSVFFFAFDRRKTNSHTAR